MNIKVATCVVNDKKIVDRLIKMAKKMRGSELLLGDLKEISDIVEKHFVTASEIIDNEIHIMSSSMPVKTAIQKLKTHLKLASEYLTFHINEDDHNGVTINWEPPIEELKENSVYLQSEDAQQDLRKVLLGEGVIDTVNERLSNIVITHESNTRIYWYLNNFLPD